MFVQLQFPVVGMYGCMSDGPGRTIPHCMLARLQVLFWSVVIVFPCLVVLSTHHYITLHHGVDNRSQLGFAVRCVSLADYYPETVTNKQSAMGYIAIRAGGACMEERCYKGRNPDMYSATPV